jgi:hypothetical protein
MIRLRTIYRSLMADNGLDWMMNLSANIRMIREAVQIIGRLVEQCPTFPPITPTS